jgi:hypothetical protein
MLSAKDKPLLPGRDQATELKSSTTTQITNPSLVATTKPPVAGKPAVRFVNSYIIKGH